MCMAALTAYACWYTDTLCVLTLSLQLLSADSPGRPQWEKFVESLIDWLFVCLFDRMTDGLTD